MKYRRVVSVAFLLLLVALVGSVRASTSVFVIEPSTEVAQNVECPNGCQSIGGNVSVVGGSIDFYVTDPSGTSVLRYENTSFVDFGVDTVQNGTYVIHLVNRLSINNVNATLFYGKNSVIVLNGEVSMKWNTVSTWTATISTPSAPLNWIEPLSQIGRLTFTVVVGPLIVGLLYQVILRRYQKYKDGESKTPVVLGLHKSEKRSLSS
jgi:hypothetical protein